MAIEVTVRDTETGETRTKTITDDFIVVCAGRHYVHFQQLFRKSGTHQITIKVDRTSASTELADRTGQT